MAQVMQNNGFIGNKGHNQLTSWDMFNQNSSASFFDPEWMFGVKDGFDVVIANPPYVHFENMEESIRDLYEQLHYASFARKGDLYCLFYEFGLNNIKEGGALCYITSNKWMKANYGSGLREVFIKNNPVTLIDFDSSRIFENATVDTNILLIEKNSYSGVTKAVSMNNLQVKSNPNLTKLVQDGVVEHSFTKDNWIVLSLAEQKLRNKVINTGTCLKDWGADIINGIKTGFNDAFIIDENKRNEILNSCVSEEERQRTENLIKPLLRGKDIQRYNAQWIGIYVIFAYNGSYKVMENEYPAIFKHLAQYEEELRKRGQVRYTPSKSKKKKVGDYLGQHHWLELDNNPSYDRLQDYSKEKIVYREISTSMDAYLDKKGMFVNNKLYFIITEHAPYLAGIINSKLFTKVILAAVNTTGGKGPAFLLNVKVPNYNVKWHKIEDKVNSICSTLNEDHTTIESEIDHLVYHLYDLTYDEVLIIDPETPITREEYESYKAE